MATHTSLTQVPRLGGIGRGPARGLSSARRWALRWGAALGRVIDQRLLGTRAQAVETGKSTGFGLERKRGEGRGCTRVLWAGLRSGGR